MASRKNFPSNVKRRRETAMIQVDRRINKYKNNMGKAKTDEKKLEWERSFHAANRERDTLLGRI
jgi:hypothetical protein